MMSLLYLLLSVLIVYRIPRRYQEALEAEQSNYCNDVEYKDIDGLWFVRSGKPTEDVPMIVFLLLSALLLLLSGYDQKEYIFLQSIATVLYIASYIDYKIRLMPDATYIYLISIGLLFSGEITGVSDIQLILGMIVGYISMYLILWITSMVLKRESMGMADVKLMAASGSIVGIYSLPAILLISSVVAMIFIPLMKNEQKPFGPFISIATMIIVIQNIYEIVNFQKIFY